LTDISDSLQNFSKVQQKSEILFTPPDIPESTYLQIQKYKSQPICKSAIATKSTPINYLSQEEEDQILLDKYHLRNITYGVFLELGAWDGIGASNTYVLQHHYGWTGIVIEGHPITAKKLLHNRSNCSLAIAQSICAEKGTVEFIETPGLASGVLSEIRNDLKNKYHKQASTVKVPCGPLSAILREFNHKYIDFFSLDVEGSELVVLNTIDFNAVRFGLILIEKQETETQKKKVFELLKFYGYVYLEEVGPNYLFRGT